LSPYYKQADHETKYAIRQLNNICHEIEGWVESYRKSKVDPEWIRPAQITTFLNAPRYDLHDEDFELFKVNRYARELGGFDCDYPYSLNDKNWKEMQIKKLKAGYESRSLR
jgi:hypothetical protein